MPNIRVTVNNPSPQRISVDQQTRTGVRQIGITSDATLAQGTVTSVSIAVTEGLSRTGSPITTSGTITISANGATTAQTGIVRLQDSLLSLNTNQALTANMGRYIASLFDGKVQNTFTISTGNGLTGGGDLTTNRTLSANDAGLTTNGIVRLQDSVLSTNTFQAATANAVNAVQRVASSANTAAIAAAASAAGVRSGTVNSVTVAASTGLLSSGSPITDSGTITLSANAASLSVNGIVQLTDVVTSTNTYGAATPNSVNAVYRVAVFANTLATTVGTAAASIRSGTVNSVSISTGTGLTQSGSPITDTGTITVSANDASVSVNGVVRLNDTLLSTNTNQALTANMGGYITQLLVGKLPNTRFINTTSPLSGGAGLDTNPTLSISMASVTTNGETRLNDTLTSANTFQAATANVANILARPFIGTYAGLVPANTAGNGQYVLTAAGIWTPQTGGGGGGGSGTVTSVSIIAGQGLSQTGSAITTSGSYTLSANDASVTQNGIVRLNDTLVSTNTNQALTANMGGYITQLLVGKISNTRFINTTSPLAGGAGLETNPTITISMASSTTNGETRLNDTVTSSNIFGAATPNAVNTVHRIATFANTLAVSANAIVYTIRSGTVNSVTVAAGTGLVSSGSPITDTGTITVSANDASISVNGVVRLNDTLASSNLNQALTANMGFWIAQQLVGKVQNTNIFTGSTTTPGLVPANNAGNGMYLLSSSGTWVAPGSGGGGGGGTVTSVSIIAGQGLSQTGSAITVSGSYTLSANDASLTQNGIVRLQDSLTSSNTGQALTANMGLYILSTKIAANGYVNGNMLIGNSISGSMDRANLYAGVGVTVTLGMGNIAVQLADATQNTLKGRSVNSGTGPVTDLGSKAAAQIVGISDYLTITPQLSDVGFPATHNSSAIAAWDGRDVEPSPNTFTGAGLWVDFKNRSTANLNIPSTATFAGLLTFAPYVDDSGANVHQLGFTHEGTGNIFYRSATRTHGFANAPIGWSKIWTANNDGAGSGLDADLLDGLDSTSFANAIVANSRTLTTTNGLSGNGSLASNLTISVQDASVTQNGIVRLQDSLASSNLTQALTANMGVFITSQFIGKVQNTRTISTTGGALQGGGDLTADRTLFIANADINTNGVVRLNDTLTSSNLTQALTANMGFLISQQLVGKVQNTTTVSTTGPLAGGGALSSSLTLTIAAASITGNGETRLNDTVASQNLFQAATANAVNAVHKIAIYANTAVVAIPLIRSGTVNSVAITTSTGLVSSGSPITDSGTISISANDASISVNGVVRLNDTLTSSNLTQALTANMGGFITQQFIGKVQNTRSVSTVGGALTGGGTLAADLVLTIANATTEVNGVVRLNDTLTSTNLTQALTANMGRYLDTFKVSNTDIFAGSTTRPGLVPANNAGNGMYLLSSSGIWVAPGSGGGGGGGTVTSVSIIAGPGLSQTGSAITVTGSYTIQANDASVTQNGVVRLQDSLASQNTGQALTANMGFYVTQLLVGKVQNTVTVSTTSPLTGGGDLSTNRTIAIQAATLLQNGEVRLQDSLTSANLGQALTANMGVFITSQLIGKVQNTRTISTVGGALTGGGDLTADRTLTVANADINTNGVVRLNDTLTSSNLTQALTANMGFLITQQLVGKTQNTRLISTGFGLSGGGDLTVDRVHGVANATLTSNGVVVLQDSLVSSNLGQALTANMGVFITSQLIGKVQNTTTISTTSPLAGGGALSSSLTLSIAAASITSNGEVRLNDTLSSSNLGQALTANMGGFITQQFVGKVQNTRTISTTGGALQGGGDLTADRTLFIANADINTNGVVRLNDTLTSSNLTQALTANMGFLITQQLIGKVQNTRSVSTAGGALTGGGTLAADLTLTIANASTTVNGVVRLNDTIYGVGNTTQAATANIANILSRPFKGTDFAGLVPANNATTNPTGNGTYVLTAAGTWVPAGSGGGGGSGTVTSVSIITGLGLAQTGSAITTAGSYTITANDASLSTNGVVVLNDTVASLNINQALTANMGRYIVLSQLPGKVQNTRTISTTSPLTGGGDLTADRTLAIQAATLVQNGEVRLQDSLASANVGQALTANMGFLISQQLIGKVQNTTTISTTSPLAGGGALSSSLTLTIQAAGINQNGEVRLNDTLASSNLGQALTANMGGYITQLFVGKVQNTRTISTVGGALTGGGTLASDLTLTIANATTGINGAVRLNDTVASLNLTQALTANMGRYVVLSLLPGKVQNTFTISTTSPLTGGGDLTTNRTLAIQAASLVQNGEVRLNDDLTSTNTFQALTANQGRALARVFSSTYNGLVPTPGASTSKFLRDDATWAAVAGSGTVTSIDINAGEGIVNSGGPITTAGSITIRGNVFTTTTNGDVPKPVTVTGLRYLTDNATWSTPAGSGGGGGGGTAAFDYGRAIAVGRNYFLY